MVARLCDALRLVGDEAQRVRCRIYAQIDALELFECVRVGVRRPAVFVFGRRLPAEDAPPESSSVVVVIIIIIEFDVFRIGAVTVFVHP